MTDKHHPVAYPADVAYQFAFCSKCRQEWQNIDFACARHQLSCGYPLPSRLPVSALVASYQDHTDLFVNDQAGELVTRVRFDNDRQADEYSARFSGLTSIERVTL